MAVSNSTPWYDHALQRVKDGPVPYERLVAEMMPLVPPGRAYRTAHTAAAHERERSGGSSEPRQYADQDLDPMRRIRAGQRRLVVHSLNETIRRGRLQAFEKGGVRMVKAGIDNFDEVKARRASSMSEYSKAFLRAVAGGDKVRVETLVPGLIATVSRPEAIAKARYDREAAYERAKSRPTKTGRRVTNRKQSSENDDYLVGARRTVMDPLSNLVERERIRQMVWVLTGSSTKARSGTTPMPQPRKPYTEEIRRLTDLGPITYHDLVREAANLVPEWYLALRTGIRQYKRGNKKPPTDELIRSGKSAVIQKAIWQAEIYGYIQYREEDGIRWVEPGPQPWYVRGVTKPRRLGPGRPLTAWGEAIKVQLADGPQALDYVLSQVAPLVPPGRAYRRTLQNRAETRGRRGLPPPPDPRTDREKTTATRAGQKQIVMFTIRNLLRYGRIVKSNVDGKTVIEMGPNPW